MRETLDELLEECGRLHGHLCPGQVLGARMALLGCELLGIIEPRGADRKKLIVWVEIDRCMADAVSAVTGARLGRRSLKYVDYGKVAATFLHTETREAVRIVARDDARELADALYAGIDNKKERQLRAYREQPHAQLFRTERVRVAYGPEDEPGRPRSRVICDRCGEGVNDYRERREGGENLCRPCAGESYYQRLT